MTNTQQHATWGELLHSAVHTPGKLLAAYTPFHNYSFGNALLALEQCIGRKIEPGPLNSYKGWLQLKRQVRKGEKGLCLCMPVTYKKRVTDKAAAETIEGSEESQDEVRQRFVFRNYWFVLAQTEGETPYEQPVPGFDLDAVLQSLNITRAPFNEINGNVQGFAHQREIAISPIAELRLKTTLHEIVPTHLVIAPDASILCRNVVGSRAPPRLPGQVPYCSGYRKFVTVTKEGQSNFERKADAPSYRKETKMEGSDREFGVVSRVCEADVPVELSSRHKNVILTVVNGGKMRRESE
jgi:hypothetical protein